MGESMTRSGGSDVVVVSWLPGGNLAPLVQAALLMAGRGLQVTALGSSATVPMLRRAGIEAHLYRHTAAPRLDLAFETRPKRLLGPAAGLDLALDVLGVLREVRPHLIIADCMLPAVIAAAESAHVPVASLIHFPYGFARTQMVRGGSWTTDLDALDATRRALKLAPVATGLDAWEKPQLLLATLPDWFDLPGQYPANLTHAGPLGVRPANRSSRPLARPRVLLSFSTTVMEGQVALVRNVVAAVKRARFDAVLTLGPALRSLRPAYEGVAVLEWASHDSVMPNVDAVITHGGLGTTLRALAHGKPLLILPLGRDQHFNAGRVATLGAGIALPADSSAGQISAGITRLIDEPPFADRARLLAHRIATDQPDEAALCALMSAMNSKTP